MNLQTYVTLSDNQAITTTSLKVAEAFGKNHRDILRKIDSISCSKEFRSAHFCAHPYKHPQNGETYTYYEMTKDGFIFLVMGFTGKKAAQIKEAYINAFNAMAEQLSTQNQRSGLRVIQLDDMNESDHEIEHGRFAAWPLTDEDGRYWMADSQLNRLFGYRRKDVVRILYGQSVEHFSADEVALIEVDSQNMVLAFEANAWAKLASYSQCPNVSEFIRMSHEHCHDRVTIKREEWERLQHHAQNMEQKYLAIASASGELQSAVSDAQVSAYMVKSLTEKKH